MALCNWIKGVSCDNIICLEDSIIDNQLFIFVFVTKVSGSKP